MKYVNVKDQDLRHALRQIVGDQITDERLAHVIELDWSEYRAEAGQSWTPIYDLTGIEYCLNLRRLMLDGNAVKSLRPLTDLIQLEELWLVQNQIANVKPLAGLPNLKTLVLEQNIKLKRVDSLAALPSLQYLNIASTGVTDLAPLVELAMLTRLAWMPPKDMTAAALRRAERIIDTLQARGVTMERYRHVEGGAQAPSS